ncbi:hypothetical protein [Enterobacter kobei]|uniref:hypothetical protein n=1 Tax=Enterobacter kobei TaxID=208224 RepID=UPI0028749035|nr:hypothetical protein [Enterobacter kobei]MDS0026501.1 hypothetical protein [Enterobacter kobei]
MEQSTSGKTPHSDEKAHGFRLLSRQLARELNDAEINAVAGGTTSWTRIRIAAQNRVMDDAEA